NLEAVDGAQSLRDFFIEHGQRSEDGDVVIIEAHLDFVIDGGPAGAYFICLPEAGDFGTDGLFKAREILRRQRNTVERSEVFANTAALEHDGTAGDLTGGGRG